MGLLVAPCSDDRSQPQQEQVELLVARLTEHSIGVEGNVPDDAGKVLPHSHMVIVVGVGTKHQTEILHAGAFEIVMHS
jgi:hypothetical protein